MYRRNQELIDQDFLEKTGMTVKESLQQHIESGDFRETVGYGGMGLEGDNTAGYGQQYLNLGLYEVPLEGFKEAQEGDYALIGFAANITRDFSTWEFKVPEEQDYVPFIVWLRWQGIEGLIVEIVANIGDKRSESLMEIRDLFDTSVGEIYSMGTLTYLRSLEDLGGYHVEPEIYLNPRYLYAEDASPVKKQALVDWDGNYVQGFTELWEIGELGRGLINIWHVQENLDEDDVGVFVDYVRMDKVQYWEPHPDPAIYDAFESEAIDPTLWETLNRTNSPYINADIYHGAFRIFNTGSLNNEGFDLRVREVRKLDGPFVFQTDIRVVSLSGGGYGTNGHFQIHSDSGGVRWWTTCRINRGLISCDVTKNENNPQQEVYSWVTNQIEISEWNTVRIEINPELGGFQYYFNGELVGTYLPDFAENLRDAELDVSIGIWVFKGLVNVEFDNIRVSD